MTSAIINALLFTAWAIGWSITGDFEYWAPAMATSGLFAIVFALTEGRR